MPQPKKWTSWRVCPYCGSRATKMYSLNNGLYHCQVCDRSYDHPGAETPTRTSEGRTSGHSTVIGECGPASDPGLRRPSGD